MTQSNNRRLDSAQSSFHTPAVFASQPAPGTGQGRRFTWSDSAWQSPRQICRLVALLLLVALVLSACVSPPEPTPEPTPEPDSGAAAALEPEARNGMYSAAPEMSIDPDKEYHAIFKTEKGDIRVRLFADRAPLTINNFVFLARDGFYNDTTFHRVLENFMAQGGDPTGSGSGGPGYQFQDEILPELQFDSAGLLAMANAGPGTNGSQFFLTFAATPWLNGNHTIFGQVVEGVDVLFSLALRDPMSQGASASPGDLLITVEIEEAE